MDHSCAQEKRKAALEKTESVGRFLDGNETLLNSVIAFAKEAKRKKSEGQKAKADIAAVRGYINEGEAEATGGNSTRTQALRERSKSGKKMRKLRRLPMRVTSLSGKKMRRLRRLPNNQEAIPNDDARTEAAEEEEDERVSAAEPLADELHARRPCHLTLSHNKPSALLSLSHTIGGVGHALSHIHARANFSRKSLSLTHTRPL